MFDVDTWQEVFASLQKNLLRTGMTAWGVFWGTFMLILMLGFGTGLEAGVTRNMLGFAGNNVFLWGRRTSIPYQGTPPGKSVRLSTRDMPLLKAAVPEVLEISPTAQLGGWREGINVSYGSTKGNFGVIGKGPKFPLLAGFSAYSGRFINELDMSERRKVAVIGEQARRILFRDEENPLGKYIKVQGVQFQVIGVMNDQQSGRGAERNNNSILVPFSSLRASFNLDDRVGSLGIVLEATADPEASELALKRALLDLHGVSPKDLSAIGANNFSEKLARVRTLFRGIRAFIWVVCIATLLAGALGVSNIMLISVKERTREFGLRKALGATPSSIISLVLQEATVLTCLAGYLGLVAGVAALQLVPLFFSPSGSTMSAPSIDLGIALLATGVLAVSGAIAGIAPARHAARIHPIVALRSE